MICLQLNVHILLTEQRFYTSLIPAIKVELHIIKSSGYSFAQCMHVLCTEV